MEEGPATQCSQQGLGLDSQGSINRVPESPPIYSQEVGTVDETGLGKGSVSDQSSSSVKGGGDFIINIDEFCEEPKPEETSGNNGTEEPTDEAEFNIEEFPESQDFPEIDEALLISAAEEAERGMKNAGETIEEAEEPPPDVLDAPPLIMSEEIALDPTLKAEDEARRAEVEQFKKFQPLDKIFPDVRCSGHNTVAFRVKTNYAPGDALDPYPDRCSPKWDSKYVPMPFCDENVVLLRNFRPPTDNPEDENSQVTSVRRIRVWDRIRETLEKYPIMCVDDFGNALKRYCRVPGDLQALRYCVEQIMVDNERASFFEKVVPFMTSLVLQTPQIITCPLPFLRKNVNHNITLSQKQVACLLANAFFSTFPRRFEAESDLPSINFKELFCETDERICKIKAEKIRCIINYFSRIEAEMPSGAITFSRKNLRHSLMPDWGKIDKGLSKLVPLLQGTIEDDGGGFLKVDFANCFIGGGALGRGAVQEEILFMIYPELIVSRLFTERMNSSEAVIITGCERFSRYKGYASNFKYDGDYHDSTPFDSRGRRTNQIVAIDALYISRPNFQYNPKHILREVNKAYVGFSAPVTDPVAIATGKWGCGAFNGDPHLKAIIQLLAASHAGRDVVFFTFGDVECLNDIMFIYESIRDMKIKEVWNLLCQYHRLCCATGKRVRSIKDFSKQFSDGHQWEAQREEMKKAEAEAAASTSKKLKDVPLTQFYAVEKKYAPGIDDESVACIINGIDRINSSRKNHQDLTKSIPPGKRQRDNELTEEEIREQLLQPDDGETPKEAAKIAGVQRSQTGNGEEKQKVEEGDCDSDNATSPKSSKRPKRVITLQDFYKDPTTEDT